MEKTASSVADEIAALRETLQKVNSALDSYAEIATRNAGDKSIAASGEVSNAHTALYMETHGLLRAVRGPIDMVYSHVEAASQTGALRAVMEMGVFEALPLDGSSVTATELSQKLNVDKELLARFMRIVTIVGPFAETGVEQYAHTPFSKTYLIPEFRGLFKMMHDEFATPFSKMYEFFREHGFKTPNSELINPFCFAHQTGDKTIWQYIGQYPERLAALNYGMGAQSQAAAWTVGIFPFASELGQIKTEEDTVLVIDIGGGKGHVTKQIKDLVGDVKGKIILQERPEVIAEITDPLPGVDIMEYDFFTPQPIQGALIYYIRRCLHDWSDDDCIRILKNTRVAMKPGVSRLLISELVLPDTGSNVLSGWMDLTMMTVSGAERTKAHWTRLLEQSGFYLNKAYHAPGTNYGAIEAYLNESWGK